MRISVVSTCIVLLATSAACTLRGRDTGLQLTRESVPTEDAVPDPNSTQPAKVESTSNAPPPFASPGMAFDVPTSGVFTLRNVGSNLAVGAAAGDLQQGIGDPMARGSQWKVVPANNQAFRLINMQTQTCIDGSPGVDTSSGLQLSPCGESSQQLWNLQFVASSGAFSIVSVANGNCLDVWNQSTAADAPITTYACWGGNNQLYQMKPVYPVAWQLPLRTAASWVIDGNNQIVRLASVNWYGASDVKFVVGGLDKQPVDAIAQLIPRLGFNSVRLPFSNAMVRSNPAVSAADVAANPHLAGKTRPAGVCGRRASP